MSWHYLQVLEEASWDPTSLDGVPSALSRLLPSRGEYYSHDREMECSNPFPSGRTSEPSTATHGEDTSTSSPEASPARTSAQRVKVRDLPEPVVDYGSRCSESLERYNLRLSSRKTVRAYVPVDSAPSCKDLPAWGMTYDGACWGLGTRVHLIDETGCGYSLPTPSACSYGSNQGGSAGRTGKVRHSLESMARHRMWPTPTVGDSKSSGSRNTKNSKAHPGISLTDAVRGDGGTGRMPTPSATDYKIASAPGQRRGQLGDPAMGVIPAGGRLHPAWVESYLMGWPIGWTDLKQLEMDRYHEWLHWHGTY